MHGSEYNPQDEDNIAENTALLVLWRSYVDAANLLPTDHDWHDEVKGTVDLLHHIVAERGLLYTAEQIPSVTPDPVMTAFVGLISATEFAVDALADEGVGRIKPTLDGARRMYAGALMAEVRRHA